jgi:hypothetical protein
MPELLGRNNIKKAKILFQPSEELKIIEFK